MEEEFSTVVMDSSRVKIHSKEALLLRTRLNYSDLVYIFYHHSTFHISREIYAYFSQMMKSALIVNDLILYSVQNSDRLTEKKEAMLILASLKNTELVNQYLKSMIKSTE